MATEFEIVVGTYEQFMLGYKVERTNDAQYSMKQTFATRSHTGSIRAVAGCERYLASAGSDDRVFIYDMNTRKEIQMLIHHKGTVTTIGFTPKASHVITGSTDGAIGVIRTGSWMTEKLWGSAHKSASVNNIAIHPSGKMFLSIGGDYVLRTWNLVKGRHAYATNLASRGPNGKLADSIQWSPNGVLFTITGCKVLEIWSTEQAEVVDSLEQQSKVVSACWLSDTKLICGLEDGNLSLYDFDSKESKIMEGHKCRVKCVGFVNDHIISCDSSGVIKLWSVHEDDDIVEMCSTGTSCRITCLALVQNLSLKPEKSDGKIVASVPTSANGDSENEEDENNVVLQPKKRRQGIVVVEEEINDVRPSLDCDINKKKEKKAKKRQVQNDEQDVLSPNKQKKLDDLLAEADNDISNVGKFVKIVKKTKKHVKLVHEEKSAPEQTKSEEFLNKKIKKQMKTKHQIKPKILKNDDDIKQNIKDSLEDAKLKEVSKYQKKRAKILKNVTDEIHSNQDDNKKFKNKKNKLNGTMSNGIIESLQKESTVISENKKSNKNKFKLSKKQETLHDNTIDALCNATKISKNKRKTNRNKLQNTSG